MIYFLEDDENIRKFVIYALKSSGFDAKPFSLPSEFYLGMQEATPSLIILDIMLPEEDGISILGKIRKNPVTAKIPVILLSAKCTEYDKVIGLDNGADDYLTKPFGTMELISRVKALLRRTENNNYIYMINGLYVCPSKHIVKVNNEDISLTLKEYKLLCLLLENGGNVVPREKILTDIWGYDFLGESRTIDVHIGSLRSKLKEGGSLIETVKGIGYKIGDSNEKKDI